MEYIGRLRSRKTVGIFIFGVFILVFYFVTFDFLVLPPKHPLEETIEDRGGMGYDLVARHWMGRYFDWSPKNVKRYRRYQHMISRQYDQR